ncbi:MAG: helix-turn-helix domain-containing protein [Halobacteriaceae archaeon]
MKRATVEVTYPPEMAHPLHRRLRTADGVSRMDLLMWGPTESVTTLSWFDADRETVTDLLGAVASAESTALVAGDGGTYAFVSQTAYEFDDAVMGLVADAEAVFLPPVTFRADGTATIEAVGEAAGLSALFDALRETLDASIVAVRPFWRRGSAAALTDRQRTALRTALSAGYYDVPRTAGVEAVADELDCATSTAGELLRKAESAVVAAHVGGR